MFAVMNYLPPKVPASWGSKRTVTNATHRLPARQQINLKSQRHALENVQ